MSPEDLDGIKAIARLLPESQTRNHIFLLLAHIDTQAVQIESLKEKLVRERAENLSWQNWSAGGNGFRVYPGWEKMMPAARQQIKAEMPEVDWK